MITILALLYLYSGVCGASVEVSTVASIHMRGVRGSVSMTQLGSSAPTTIQITLTGDGIRDYTWQINQFPVRHDSTDPCSTQYIGNVYKAFSPKAVTLDLNPLTIERHISLTDNNVQLTGVDSVTGRSFLLRSNDHEVCGTLLPYADTVIAMAHPGRAVLGDVYFRQSASDNRASTTVFMDLQSMDHSQLDSTMTFEIHEKKPTRPGEHCGMGDPYNPYYAQPSTDCDPLHHDKCAVGDLASKHGPIPVSGATSQQILVTDTNLPLHGEESVVGKVLMIKSGGQCRACGEIRVLESKRVKAAFSAQGVIGYMEFIQTSPFDPTHVSVKLDNLKGRAAKYHVYQWPVPPRLTAEENVCSGGHVGGHHNPLQMGSSLAATSGTNDQYEIGDLSGKFSSLAGYDSYSKTFTDWNLPLFGANSVIGRSVVIHSTDGARFICASIGYPGDHVVMATVTFYHTVIGQIVLHQSEADPGSDTTMMSQLSFANGSSSSVEGLKLAIHEKPTTDDFVLSGQDRCKQAGSVNKHAGYGSVGVGEGGSWHKDFLTLSGLPLSGKYSVIGQSVVIYEPDGVTPLACGTVTLQRPCSASVNQWSSDHEIGFIRFTQDETNREWTEVNIGLEYLNGKAYAYHIHQYPVHLLKSDICDVGGHFNPFSVDKTHSPAATTGSMDEYEVGDLSGKFGAPSGRGSVFAERQDHNLPLSGPHSVIGRSVVVHTQNTETKRICGTVTANIDSSVSHVRQASAQFDDDKVKGYIRFTQVVHADNCSLDDTQVEVLINYLHGHTTREHKWHVHEYSIDTTSSFGKCKSAGGHHNPFQVSTAKESDYSSSCGITNQLRCELGDLSGKHGKYDIGGGERFYTDVNLPLTGPFSVIGRSVVVHAENSGAARFICADILPENTPSLLYSFPVKNFLSEALQRSVADVLSVQTWDIAVQWLQYKDPCSTVRIFFMGPSAAELKNSFEAMTAKPDLIRKQMGEFAPGACTGEKVSINTPAAHSDNSALTLEVVPIHLLLAVAVNVYLF